MSRNRLSTCQRMSAFKLRNLTSLSDFGRTADSAYRRHVFVNHFYTRNTHGAHRELVVKTSTEYSTLFMSATDHVGYTHKVRVICQQSEVFSRFSLISLDR